MAIPDWPAGLPVKARMRPRRWPESHQPPAVTEVEDGPDVMRARAATVVATIDYAIVMTDAQVGVFRAFAVGTLGRSTGHFRMQVPVPGVGYRWRRCWIKGGRWTVDEIGSDYLVSFTLCVLGG
ncbi:hypothetical protein RHODGE_RHODGE_02835 [Rhodoplanes serenus]|uniref:Uncharacterized protein n=1 Tax=Rhodoplanes serenus TaxID=200615 RepID=A0A3S4BGZ3_9BRAD|nr:hypothetical protein [Rhodoplanes serenus]VCU09666.1 hypothetical protein RHODGE_RHODGE_02835 [Rhodoplanes serenus]